MIKRLWVTWLIMVLGFLTSTTSYALSYSECSALRSDQDFAISFDVINALKNENVGVSKGVGGLNILPINLWSDQAFTLFPKAIYESSLQYFRNYKIWLEYRADNSGGGNKTGTLTYYRVIGGTWSLLQSVDVDLSGINSVHLAIYGVNVDNLACDTESVSPPSLQTSRPEICDLFPQPVQSWITAGSANYNYYGPSLLHVTNSTVRINGWSDDYKDANTVQLHYAYDPNQKWNAVRVGFDYVGDTYNAYGYKEVAVCDGMGCYPGNNDGNINERKIEAPSLVGATYTSLTSLEIVDDTALYSLNGYNHVCSANPTSSSVCSYQDLGNGHIAITILKDLNSLYVRTYKGKTLTVHFADNLSVAHFRYEYGVEAYFDANKTINFRTLVTATGVKMHFETGAWVNVSGSDLYSVDFQLNNSVQFNYIGESDTNFVYPVIYGPTATYQFKGNLFKGYLLARNVLLDTTITIQGAVTANYLLMSNSAKIEAIPGYSRCGTSNDKTYTLSISPNEDYSLTCKAQDVTFQVLDEDGAAATDYSGYIQVSPYTNLTVVTGSGSNGLYQPDSNGLLELNLSATKAQDVTLSAYLSTQTDSSNTVTGTYHFVPYRFVVDDQPVIADKPTQISLAVEACDEQNNTIDIGYTGTPSYTSIWNAPENGVGSLTLDNRTFIAGKATAMLTMEDSGVKTVTLEDGNFNCAALNNDCPIKGNGTLKGSFTVYSRPWTFAICPSGTNEMDGNITDEESTGFTSAGSSFALVVKPIRWQSNGSTSGEIASASYCSSAVTQNFFSTNSQLSATVELTHNVAQPADGVDGVLKSGESTSVTLANDASSSEYSFAGLTWSEVGVLRVKANTVRDASGTPTPYLQNDLSIQTGYRDIGRFYPAYLAITTNSWNYADGLDDFAYMGQPISYGFTVEAKNLSGQATTNYSRFANALKAQIRLVAVDTNSDYEDMSSRVADYNDHFWSGTDWNSGADLTVNHSFTFARLETLQSPLTTKPDGPFTAGFGLQVTTGPDGVDFQDNGLTHKVNGVLVSTDKVFPLQPDLRYGRLAFSDVGGNSTSSVNVPLSAQYWNGNQFVTNTDDSGSLLSIDGDKVCKNTIWQSQAQTSSSQLTGITGNVAVSSGQNHQIYAQPDADSSLREQVRFWMRINESSPQVNEQNIDCGGAYLDQPWLQFNWRNEGDEDPSTVITFGVYRGNDRVIYRGEPGINN